jgi:hypothetical protein
MCLLCALWFLLVELFMRESEKVMFQIYREASYNRRYKVVYFTELNEHNKESEINRAMAGDHFFDGFLNGVRKDEAKAIIDRMLLRLNSGEQAQPDELERELSGYLA